MNVVDVIQFSFVLVIFSALPLGCAVVLLSVVRQQWDGWRKNWDVIAITMLFVVLMVGASIFGVMYSEESISKPSMSLLYEQPDGSICYVDSTRMCDEKRFFHGILVPGKNTSRDDVCLYCQKTFRMHYTKKDKAGLDWSWYAPWD